MSLEEALNKNTAAVVALTEALAKGGASTGGSGGTTKPADAYTPKHTVDEMKAALRECKEKCGQPVAKSIVTDVGKADKMDNITDPKLIDAVYDKAKEEIKKKEAGGDL